MKAQTGQLPLFAPADSLCMYLILISLPDKISEDVVRMKKVFKEKYGSYSSEYSTPHLSVCSFLLMGNRSEKTFTLLRERLQDIPSFKLRIEGFRSFESSKVISLDVLPSGSFDRLIQEMDQARRELRIRKNYTASPTPHITIAKGLDKPVFESAEKEWLRQKYRSVFQADRLTVLSYDFEDKRYRRYDELKLNGA